MAGEKGLAPAMLEQAHQMFVDNVRGLTLEEMLDAADGYHISTAGHGVRPPWMTDDEAAAFEREQ